MSCTFRANRVLPLVCSVIDPSQKKIYDPVNWRSPGDRDIARMTSTWGDGTVSVTTDFESDAFLWSFTTFMTAIRQAQTIEDRIHAAIQ